MKTLVEAMALVFLVMFLFLQNWRATLIPTIVVPIALAGACLGLWVLGFSINVLTLFGMVLAIGILVDDAIVVIENVERIMTRGGTVAVRRDGQGDDADHLGRSSASRWCWSRCSCRWRSFPGSTGGIYRQFSLTLAISIAFSALLALTLTPALCATLLKPHARDDAHAARRAARRDRFFGGFNGWFARTTDRYQGGVGAILARPLRFLGVFARARRP